MKKPKKMKPVKAWALVEKDTGDAWCGMTYQSRSIARGHLGKAHAEWRIVRVEIKEVTPCRKR